MPIARTIPFGIAVLAALAATVSSGPATAADADHLIVVKLFQSQGCSSCPPATAMLNRFADRADFLPLNFGVTYRDRLGWKDKFAHPAYTERQWDYAQSGNRGNVATPQFIINGRGEHSGRVLPHRNVVTGLRSLGTRQGNAAVFGQPAYRDANERSAILLQQGTGGRIIVAEKL